MADAKQKSRSVESASTPQATTSSASKEFGAEEQSADLEKRHGKQKRARRFMGKLLVNGKDFYKK